MNFEGISDRELFQMIKSYCISNKTFEINTAFDEFTIRIYRSYFNSEFWLFNDSLFIKYNNGTLKNIISIDDILHCFSKIFTKRTIIPFDLAIKCNLIINHDK